MQCNVCMCNVCFLLQGVALWNNGQRGSYPLQIKELLKGVAFIFMSGTEFIADVATAFLVQTQWHSRSD